MADNRTKIMRVAAELGLTVYALNYNTPRQLEMGDEDGGWEIETAQGGFGAITADGLISEMCDRFGEDPNETTAPALLHPASAGGFRAGGVR